MHRVLVSFAFAAASGAALFITGCDCSGGLGGGGPCEGSGTIAGCGQVCGDTRPCPAGLYCGGANVCTADCRAGTSESGCGPSAMCSPDGRCVARMDGGGREPFDGAPPDSTCARVMVGASRVTPTVIVVIDRSGSMDEDFDRGMSRWDVLRSSLLGMPDGLLFSLQSSVRFGIAMYSQDSDIRGCPDLLTVPARLNNYAAIEAEYSRREPAGGTPTGDSIQAILSMIDTLAPERGTDPVILVLATDGEPDTCEDGDDEVGGRRESIAAVTAAQAMGIDTYAISVGTDVGEAHLQDVANAGLGRTVPPDMNAPYYVATDTTGLSSALETIIGGAVSCTLELEGTISDLAMACAGTVRIGTDVLECGTEWRAVDATHIEILGAACDRLLSGSEEVSGEFPCGIIIF